MTVNSLDKATDEYFVIAVHATKVLEYHVACPQSLCYAHGDNKATAYSVICRYRNLTRPEMHTDESSRCKWQVVAYSRTATTNFGLLTTFCKRKYFMAGQLLDIRCCRRTHQTTQERSNMKFYRVLSNFRTKSYQMNLGVIVNYECYRTIRS